MKLIFSQTNCAYPVCTRVLKLREILQSRKTDFFDSKTVARLTVAVVAEFANSTELWVFAYRCLETGWGGVVYPLNFAKEKFHPRLREESSVCIDRKTIQRQTLLLFNPPSSPSPPITTPSSRSFSSFLARSLLDSSGELAAVNVHTSLSLSCTSPGGVNSSTWKCNVVGSFWKPVVWDLSRVSRHFD